MSPSGGDSVACAMIASWAQGSRPQDRFRYPMFVVVCRAATSFLRTAGDAPRQKITTSRLYLSGRTVSSKRPVAFRVRNRRGCSTVFAGGCVGALAQVYPSRCP